MGGGYAEVLPGVAESLFARAQAACVNVTVVPASFSTDPYAISARERAQNLLDAERRCGALEASLQALAPPGVTCRVVLAPIFVRGDAQSKTSLRHFGRDVHAVFLLGGDQSVAMRVLRGTPVEDALRALYTRGGVIAGTSAGAGMQSRTMLAGFSRSYNVQNSLHAGAAAVWTKRRERGLAFGVREAIFDQHFFQRGRLGRLLEAITQPGAPGVGVGIDAYTGVRVHDGGRLDDVFGLYSVAVLDARSLGRSAGLQRNRRQGTISVRNVLVHLLGPGAHSYDLRTRRHSLAPAPQSATRDFGALRLPPGAGPLFLCGGLDEAQRTQDPAWRLYLAAGTQPAGCAVIASDSADVDQVRLAGACAAWRAGAPLWLEGAAAALAGAHHCAGHAPQTACEPEHLPAAEAAVIAARRAVLRGNVQMEDGLGLLPFNIEPRVVENAGWGRLFALACEHTDQPALGIGINTTLMVGAGGGEVLGAEAVIALDLRAATCTVAPNGAYVVANGLLDVFAPGEKVQPQVHDSTLTCAGAIQLQRIPCAEGGPLLWS
jgi:cyanophycinase